MPKVRKRSSQLSKKSYDAKQKCTSKRQELMDENSEPQQANQHTEAHEKQSTHSLTQVGIKLSSFLVSEANI